MTSEKQLFKKAILEALSQQYEHDLAECKEDAKCSKAHYVRISEITGIPLMQIMHKRKGFKRTFVAILIAAALLLVGCTAYIYRNEIREFFVEFYDTYIKVSYMDEQIENKVGIQEYYSLSYVPEEYTLVSEYKDIVRSKYIWVTSTGKRLEFEQLIIDGVYIAFDSEKGDTQAIVYGDVIVYYRKNNGLYYYVWNDGKYTMKLRTNEKLSDYQLNAIIDGLVK